MAVDLMTGPSPGPNGEPVTTTIQQVSPSWTRGSSTGKLSRETRRALEEQQAAEAASIAAMQGGGPVAAPPTDEDVQAQIASQENSAAAVPKTDEPAPYVPPGATRDDQLERLMSANAPASPPAARYTSQQMQAAPEMQAPKTFEAAQDEANADVARGKARAAQEFQAEQQRIETERQRRMADAQQRLDALTAHKEQNTHITSLWEDMTAPRRVLASIGLAMGSLGASLTGSQNHAQQMLMHEMDLDLERKKAKAENYMEQMRIAGAAPGQIQQWAQGAQQHLLATQQAQINTLESKASTMLAPFPQAQRALGSTMAAAKAKVATERASFLAQHTAKTATSGSSQEGTKVATTEGKAQSGAGSAGDKASEGLKLAGLTSSAKIAKEFAESGGPSAESLTTARDNAARMSGGRKMEEEGGVGIVKAEASRFVGLVPDNVSKGMSHEEGQQVLQARTFFDDVAEAQVRSGVLPADQAAAWIEAKVEPLYSATPAERKAFWQDWSERVGGAEAVSGKRQARVEAGMAKAGGEAPKDAPVKPPTTAELVKLRPEQRKVVLALPPKQQRYYVEALAVPMSSPDYAEAQGFIRAENAKGLGLKGK
jgi:hypothetical protein